MSFRSSFIGALSAGLVLMAIAAGLYFFTDTGRKIVDSIFDSTAPVSKPVQLVLMPPFKSYMTVEQAQNILAKLPLTVETSRNEVPKLQNVPAKTLDTIVVESYKHFEVSGKLTLEFINDQLYEVVFNPYVAEDYISVARNKLGLRPNPAKNARSEIIRGNKRITSNVFLAVTKVGKSLRTQPYVIWQDLHLLALRRQ